MSGTVIDSLVLEFGLDPNNFNIGQQSALATLRHFEQEATRSAKGIETETKRVTATLNDFRREAITTLGVFFGGKGIKDFITDIINLDASTERLSRIFNIPPEKIGAWQNAFIMIGGTANDANAALAALNTTLTRVATTGQVGPLAPLGAFHVSPFKNEKGGLQTADNYALELADSLDRLKAAHQIDNRIAADLLAQGGIAPGLINMILEGGAKMRQRLTEGGKNMLPPGEAEKAQEAIGKFNIALNNLGRAAAHAATLLTGLVDALTNFLNLLPSINDTPEQRRARDAKELAARGGVTLHDELGARFPVPKVISEAVSRGIYGPSSNTPSAAAPSTGTAATDALLASKGYANLTLWEIAQRSFGPNVSPEHITALRNTTGLQPGDVPNLKDAAVRKQVLAGISRGTHLALPFAARFPEAPFPIGARAAVTPFSIAAGAKGGTTSSIQIGDIHVNAPQAKDAKGISQEIGTHLSRSVNAAAFNTGPQ